MRRTTGHSTQYALVEPKASEQSKKHMERHASNRLLVHQSSTQMILAFASSIAFAAGHHFFYNRFNQHQVDKVDISQAWIVRIGTGLAFLVKTLLVVSTTIAFMQHQWLAIKSTPFKIRQLDLICSILSNPLGFFQTRAWLRIPSLLLLAVITWLLPIAAIITPATITVIAHREITSQAGTPRQLYFDPYQYANLQTEARTDYVGPSSDTSRTAFSSAMLGEILAIPTTFVNESYTLDFVGPALRCDFADAALINETYNAYDEQLTGIENQYRYIAWVPNTSSRFDLTSSNQSSTLSSPYLDTVSMDTAHIYIIPNTSVAGPINVGGIPVTSPDDHYGYQDLLDCKLYNASYQAFMNFSYPSQVIDIKSRVMLNPVNVSLDISDFYQSTSDSIFAPNDKQAQRICYQAVMETIGHLLVGYEWWRDGYKVTSKTSWSMMSIDWTDRASAQQGVESLFQNITLSMLSSTSLTMNESVARQNQVSVDVYSNYNIYSYHPGDLWFAYGIAIGAALLCTLLGLYAIWRNDGASYQNLFSTFIRTTHRNRSLRDLIEPYDSGAEPLPKALAEARVLLREDSN